MNKGDFEKLGELYGDVGSWAIWAPELDRPKSNIGNLSVFDDPELYLKVNPQYAFIGLNASGGRAPGAKIIWWENFHSPSGRHHDYKLRYALKDTPYWGSYMTDLIKRYPELHSENVLSHIKNNPDVLKKNLDWFNEEMSLLDKPVLIAMGGAVYDLLTQNLSHKYKIISIKHYSYTISKENYRKELLEKMSKI